MFDGNVLLGGRLQLFGGKDKDREDYIILHKNKIN